MFGLVRSVNEDGTYRVTVHHWCLEPGQYNWSREELLQHTAEGLCIGGVSEGEITPYATYKEYIEAEAVKNALFGVFPHVRYALYDEGGQEVSGEDDSKALCHGGLFCYSKEVFDSGLDTVEFPDGVVVCGIDCDEHDHLSRISEFRMPDSVEYMTFIKGWGRLHSVTHLEFPRDMTVIGAGLFQDMPNLQSITFPKGLTRISDAAFANQKHLREIDIPDTVTRIGAQAFFNCTELRKVRLSNNLLVLHDKVFEDCSKLEQVIFGDKLRELGKNCFARCGFKELELPESIQRYGSGCFQHCKDLQRVRLYALHEKLGTSQSCKELSDVQHPNMPAFCFCYNLQEVEVVGTGKYLQDKLFMRTEKLTKVQLPDTLVEIADALFSGCTQLTECQLPKGLQTIGNMAFYDTRLEQIEIPDGVREVGKGAFCNTALEHVVLPDSVETIGAGAFSGCTRLLDIRLSENLRVLPKGMFVGAQRLKSLTIPASVTTIEQDAFKDISRLQTLIFNNYVSESLWGSEDGRNSVSRIEFRGGIKTLWAGMFAYFAILDEFHIPADVESIDKGFLDSTYDNLGKIYIPTQRVYDMLMALGFPCDKSNHWHQFIKEF